MAETMTSAGQTVLLATFYVKGALCAVDAAGIQEVIRLGPLTPVRHAPEQIAGIVNLRGRIVTVLDLGLQLGFPAITPSPDSRIFIVEDRHEFIGLLVDRVDEVVEVESDRWLPPPANVSWGQARFFKGICRVRDRVITLLDAGQILSDPPQ